MKHDQFDLVTMSWPMPDFSVCCSIVFANKIVLSVLRFRFVYSLTLLHVVTTLLGLRCFAALGLFARKELPLRPLLTLSGAFVGYIVFWNLSLQVRHTSRPRLALQCMQLGYSNYRLQACS